MITHNDGIPLFIYYQSIKPFVNLVSDSSGQSAYVDGILGELGSSFPGTVLPPKELLYEVLERLIQNKKVTQTPKGYFITGTEQDNCPDSDEESIYRKADAGGSAIHKNSSNSFRRCSSLRNSLKKGRVSRVNM